MEKQIPSFSNYTVDENGIVRETKSNGIIEPEIGRRGNEYRVTLKNDAWKVTRPKISRLVLMTFCPVKDLYYDWMTAVYRNGDQSNFKLSNLVWDSFGYAPSLDPLDVINRDIFVTIPGFSNYQITPSGILRNKKTGDILTPGLSSAGYLCCRVTDDFGKSTYVGVHHLMARALLEHPHDVDQLVTNHINGVKIDNRPENLEWVSYSRNIFHAYYTGLRAETIPIYAKNVETSELRMFPSLNSAARFFGNSNPGRVHWWLYHGAKNKVRDGWLVSLTNDWNIETCPASPKCEVEIP